MKYILSLTALLTFCAGCTSRTFSTTSRTAIEQLLLSGAVDKAVGKISLPELADKKAYLDFSYLESYDSGYVKSALKAHISSMGAKVLDEPDKADYIIQVSCGALASEYKNSLFGIPALPVPGTSMTLPELALWKEVEQDGVAKLLIAVYSDEKFISKKYYYGKVERDEGFLIFLRFQPKDDLRKAWQRADQEIDPEGFKNRAKSEDEI